MAFSRGPLRVPAPAHVRVSVFAVGQRVYVACATNQSARVLLTDDAGKKALASLGDGAEVVILAWRPAWAGTTQYRVRVTASGLEGWLPVANLRNTEVAVAPAPTVPPPSDARPATVRVGELRTPGRRFGQRFES